MVIIKRNGSREDFNPEKIGVAAVRALEETETPYGKEYPLQIGKAIQAFFEAQNKEEITISEVQDATELMLISDYPAAGKAYILYRRERDNLWKYGWDMTDLQRDIYESKYRHGKETFKEFVERVAKNNRPIQKAILEKKFIPAGRILAGRGLNEEGRRISYFNCYVIKPPEDNLESIWDTAKYMARTYSAGGGCGTDLSKLRPRDAVVNNAARTTSGAVSFMDLYSLTTGLIGQNSRRGALMLTMSSRHPDIEEFIDVKKDLNKVTFANISIRVDREFMEAARKGDMYNLEFTVEATGEKIEKVINARELLIKISKNIHQMAEPGFVFWDKINSWHLKSEQEEFEFASLNPCGR